LDYYITEGNGKINLKRAETILEKLGQVEESFLITFTNNRIYFENKNRELTKRGAIVNVNRDKKDILYEKFKRLNEKSKNEENNLIEASKNNEIIEKNLNKSSSLNTKLIKEKKEIKEINKDEINLDLNEEEEENVEKFIHLVEPKIEDLSNLITQENLSQNFGEEEKIDIKIIQEKPDENFKRIFKEYVKESENEKVSKYIDTVRLGESGYKDRYYLDKFKTPYSNSEFRNLIKKSYIEGICWVFHYYYNGCVSWSWYYPFHYAPFASDLNQIGDLKIDFDMGEPFEPVEQLLSVLPPYSSYALPKTLRILMHDKDSEIIDFFPKDIMLDINGHPFSWMGVNLIPFVDEDRIRSVVQRQKQYFTVEELERNKQFKPLIFFNNKENENFKNLIGENYKKENYVIKIDTPNIRIFSGILSFYDDLINKEKHYISKIEGLNIKIVKDSKIGAMEFQNAESKPHFSRLLKGVVIPQKIVLEDNLDFYNKKGFRGEQTIKLVNSILRYQNEIENEFKNSLFDRNYFNNNRAFEYNPAEIEMIRKKRYRERESILSGNNERSGGPSNPGNFAYNVIKQTESYNQRAFNSKGNLQKKQDMKFTNRRFLNEDQANFNNNYNYKNFNPNQYNKNIDLNIDNQNNINFNENPNLPTFNNQMPFINNNMNTTYFMNNNSVNMIPPTNFNYGNQLINQNPNLNINMMHNINLNMGQNTNQYAYKNFNLNSDNSNNNKNNDLLSQYHMYKGKNQ